MTDGVRGWEGEDAWVTVRAGAGFACGAGSGAGPLECLGAGSGDWPPATAGAAKVAAKARHAAVTSARRGSIRLNVRDPRSPNTSPPTVNWDGLPSRPTCQTRRPVGSEPQRPTDTATEPRAPEPNGEEPDVGKAEQHPELQHRPSVLERPVGQRGHGRLANNGPSGLRRDKPVACRPQSRRRSGRFRGMSCD